SQDYDLALRVTENIGEGQIRHIPRVLYHWRAVKGSVAFDQGEKPFASERARRAIKDHLDRIGVGAAVESTEIDLHRVRYALPQPKPSVSMIHVTKGLTAKDLNQAVAASDDPILCFFDPDLEPIQGDWTDELSSFVFQPGIGIVGGRVLDRKGRI